MSVLEAVGEGGVSGVTVFLDGKRVGVTHWATDTLTPGMHEFSSSVKAINGCPSATERGRRPFVVR